MERDDIRKTATYSLALSTLARLATIAQKEDRSMSAIVEDAINAYVDQNIIF